MPKKKTPVYPILGSGHTQTAATLGTGTISGIVNGSTITTTGTGPASYLTGNGTWTIPSSHFYPAPQISLRAHDEGIQIEMRTKGGKSAKITIPDHEVINAMSAISDFLHSKGVNNKIDYE